MATGADELPVDAPSRPAPAPLERPWIEIRPGGRFLPRLDLRELWDYRDVGVILVVRDLKIRYKQTFFGVGWAIIQPLVAMVVFALILGRGVGISGDGVPYGAMVIAGLAIWSPFNTSLMAATESLAGNANMVTKVYIPRLMAPLAAVTAPLVDLTIALSIAVVVTVVAGVSLSVTVVLLPACALATVVVAFGLALWLSALNVLYRDVRYALGFLMQLLFFLSPVVYPSSVTGSGWEQYLYAVNPLVGVIGLVRWALLGLPAPPAGVLLVSLAATTLLMASGLVFFRRMERQFADRI
ncbi:MAG TPA: ABC transporter permease [Solirubrobacteraceae bacterium]|jgi:ABC-type polysaccharide/polyol phosphate export permease|nr:ABC transporter permease [Solirubrobacteraceae bacterium]